jgi:hypothetical protein
MNTYCSVSYPANELVEREGYWKFRIFPQSDKAEEVRTDIGGNETWPNDFIKVYLINKV